MRQVQKVGVPAIPSALSISHRATLSRLPFGSLRSVFGRREYARLAEISVAHLCKLRHSAADIGENFPHDAVWRRTFGISPGNDISRLSNRRVIRCPTPRGDAVLARKRSQ